MSELLLDREKLEQDGYSPVGVDLGFSDYQTAIERYQAYLELDEKYHAATRFSPDPHNQFDFGQYTRTIGNTHGIRGADQDNKDIFHYGAMTRQVVETRLRGDIPKDMRNFLEAAEEIFWQSHKASIQALDTLDVEKTGLVGLSYPEQGIITDLVRFILYYPSENKTLAKKHFDRSEATITLAQFPAGLRIGPGQNGMVVDVDEQYLEYIDGKLKPVSYVEGQGNFMLGSGWNRILPQYRKGNESLQLGWHDAIETEAALSDRVLRWAIIRFINPSMEHYGEYVIPTPPETRPYKQLGRLTLPGSVHF